MTRKIEVQSHSSHNSYDSVNSSTCLKSYRNRCKVDLNKNNFEELPKLESDFVNDLNICDISQTHSFLRIDLALTLWQLFYKAIIICV